LEGTTLTVPQRTCGGAFVEEFVDIVVVEAIVSPDVV
jgi:hypothetical protein